MFHKLLMDNIDVLQWNGTMTCFETTNAIRKLFVIYEKKTILTQ